jgi:hypothetical protein
MRADGLVVACAALSLSGAAAWVTVSSAGLAAGRAGLQNVHKADSAYRRAPEPLQSMRRKRQVQMNAHEHDVPGERYYGPASKPLLDMVKVPADMKRFSMTELKQLAYELRWETLDVRMHHLYGL